MPKANRDHLMPPKGGSIEGTSINIESFIRRAPVKCVRLTLQCPGCLKGELQMTGFMAQGPEGRPVMQHRCKCGYECAVGGKTFPGVEYEPIDDAPDWPRIIDGLARRIENLELALAPKLE